MKVVLYNKETIGFDPCSVEFKKNLEMSQDCEEHTYNNYKTFTIKASCQPARDTVEMTPIHRIFISTDGELYI